VSAQACVCVCVRAHAFARVRMRARVRACERVECVREHAYVSVHACVHVHACVLLRERWIPGSQPADSESHYVMRGVGVCDWTNKPIPAGEGVALLGHWIGLGAGAADDVDLAIHERRRCEARS
jgi:hypothetical protein